MHTNNLTERKEIVVKDEIPLYVPKDDNPFSDKNRPFFTERGDMLDIINRHSTEEILDAMDRHHLICDVLACSYEDEQRKEKLKEKAWEKKHPIKSFFKKLGEKLK